MAKKESGAFKTSIWLFRTIARAGDCRVFFIIALTLIGGLIPSVQIFITARMVDAVVRALQEALPAGLLFQKAGFWMGLLGLSILLEKLQQMFKIPLEIIMRDTIRIYTNRLLLQKARRLEFVGIETADFQKAFRLAREFTDLFTNSINDVLVLLKSVIIITSIIGVLASIKWSIALILVLGALPVLAVSVVIRKRTHAYQAGIIPTRLLADYYEQLLVRWQYAKEIRIFLLKNPLLARWYAILSELKQQELKIERINTGQSFAANTVSSLALIACLIILVFDIVNGKGSVGSYVALSGSLYWFMDTAGTLINSFTAYNALLLKVSHIIDFLELPEKEKKPGQRLSFPGRLQKGIIINDLTFYHPGRKEPTLFKINAHINPNEKIAIIGANGAGKTTFIKLLLGLYNPATGSITYDSIKAADIDPDSLLDNFACVVQDFIQYQLPAFDNIALGALEKKFDLEQIRSLAAKVGMDNSIMQLPGKYETWFGKLAENSHELSGGQWQKIAIARALARDTQLLVLDEPTASLDPIAEAEIFRQFSQLAAGRTTFLVSHRVGITRSADRIFLFDRGMLVETGTHRELLDKDGYYAKLYKAQAGMYEIKGSAG